MIPVRFTLFAAYALLLSGCSATFYGQDGKLLAKVPWPQKATLQSQTATLTVEPGPGTVEALQTTTLGLANQAPALAVAVVGKIAESNQTEK
jgi:hypothetical protein